MFSRIESGAKRTFAYIGAFLLITLVLCVPVGVLGSSNIVWGEDNQYGRVDVPGTGVVHLPSGSVDVSLAILLPGRGNETPDLPFPGNLALSVQSVDGAVDAKVHRDFGSSENANDNEDNTQRHAFTVDVPKTGDYRITAHGSFLGIGVNAEYWFGHGPPLPGVYVPLVAAGLALVGGLGWVYLRPRMRRKSKPAGPEPMFADAPPSYIARDHVHTADHIRPPDHLHVPHHQPSGNRVDDLSRLAELHQQGSLTDDEFTAAKAKIIGS